MPIFRFFSLPKTVPYIRLVILSYLRFGLRGADNIAVTIEKSAMRPQAVMARADYLRDGPSFPLSKNGSIEPFLRVLGLFTCKKI